MNRGRYPAIALALTLIAGCSSSRVSAPNAAPDRPITGAQGRTAQFVVDCPLSHVLDDDPIVYPGEPGESHTHLFFGNESTDAQSDLDSLLAGSSTCDQPRDTASYWVPALYDGSQQLSAIRSVAYYRPGLGVDPTTIVAYPPGLKVIAGDHLAYVEQQQSTAVVAWTCGVGIDRLAAPPTCPASRTLRMLVTFPDCWNGVDVDSADHRSHMAYSRGGQCSAQHPVPVPQLQFSVDFGFSGDPSELSLASGDIYSGHADFFNAWDQPTLEHTIGLCLNRDVVCGIASAR